MKKHITIGPETFTIIVSKTTVIEDAYTETVGGVNTWTVKAMKDEVLLNVDKTKSEMFVIPLVENAESFIRKAAIHKSEEKTLEEKLKELGFN
jgi:hypothetical protein